TTSKSLAKQVAAEVDAQLQQLPPSNPAHVSIERTGAIILARSSTAAADFIDRFAPEHLSLPQQGKTFIQGSLSPGTVFVGPWAAQPLGDYASCSNHVLPTGGWGRRRGGLSTADFVKCISVQSIGRRGFTRLAGDVQALARAEGLLAHANAVEVRR